MEYSRLSRCFRDDPPPTTRIQRTTAAGWHVRASRAGCGRCSRQSQPDGSRSGSPTETTVMKSTNRFAIALLVGFWSGAAALPASAAEFNTPCRTCGPCGGAGGTVTPYGDTGCGPRYCGAKHDELCGPDPCDACNRWRGCNGARERPDMLAPWQLPPGRGFQTAAEIGYSGNGGGGPCLECRSPIYRLW
jgi:hypothetical protein